VESCTPTAAQSDRDLGRAQSRGNSIRVQSSVSAAEADHPLQSSLGACRSLLEVRLEGQFGVQPGIEPLCRAFFDYKCLSPDVNDCISFFLEDFTTSAEHEKLGLADLDIDFVV
jgi:hypothetical protein